MIKGFTGVDQAYESPEQPDLTLHADQFTVAQCVQKVLELLYNKVDGNIR